MLSDVYGRLLNKNRSAQHILQFDYESVMSQLKPIPCECMMMMRSEKERQREKEKESESRYTETEPCVRCEICI